MTPKEKALELYNKMYSTNSHPNSVEVRKESAKDCALIAVNEIISSREEDGAFNDTMSYNGSEYYTPHPLYLTYWKQVKQEIEKL